MSKLTLLSTKKMTAEQKTALSDFDVQEERFIKVDLKSSIEIKDTIACAVFTSQNAVKAVFRESKADVVKFLKVFCVGDKTAQLLESFGVDVAGVSHSAYELANLLVSAFSLSKGMNQRITFFCGNLRRDELPNVLQENGVEVEEVAVYQTVLLPKKIEQEFDGVLFFSPSAVQSYVKAGNSVESTAFCIGNTTAIAAIMEFEKVYVAEIPSIESVIESVVENLK